MRDRLIILLCFLMCLLFIEVMYEVGESNRISPTSSISPISTDTKHNSDKKDTPTSILPKETSNVVEDIKVTEKPVQPMVTLEARKVVNGYIFVGDSRFVGMDNICDIDSNSKYFVVAKVGEGYDWLIDEAIPQMNKIRDENKNITSWNLVINLGINDLYNLNKYKDIYDNFSLDYNIYVVSVNPIERHKSITNKDIEEFNNALKSVNKSIYIDTYKYLKTKGYSTTDGLHYTNDTYKKIFEFIDKNIDSK